METLSIITALLFFSLFGNSEEQNVQTKQCINRKSEISQPLYVHTDTIKASFPGGETALSTFLNENIQYPYNPENRAYSGKIEVTIAIASTGKITYYRILNSPNKDISGEIKRVVKLMPEWTPASSNNTAIADSVKVLFPFVYKKE